jgi:uncharacterized protein (TIGR03437 family)
MQRNARILGAKIGVGLAIIPVLIFAYANGPDPRYTGAPGDHVDASGHQDACTYCHTGTPLNGGGGAVQLTSSEGTSYTPGKVQTFTITINDSKATVYGFQMTARIDSNPVFGQAGDFTAGPQQYVLCDFGNPKPPQGCPANQSVQFAEHSSPYTTNIINVRWAPPLSNVGTVTIYVAANAANGDGNDTGDHIYTTKLQLCPGGCAAPAPVITTGGVQSAGGFSAKAGCAPGTWLEIFGSNLAATTRTWAGSDFSGSNAPTSLDGVTVTIGGKNAYVDYVSPGQVNVQVPDGIPTGPGVPLVLTSGGVQSSPFILQPADLAPALLAPAQAPFIVNGKQYVVAQLQDQSFTGIPTRPAKPGDVVTIYGIGFGPVTPATPAGTIASGVTSLTNQATFQFGQTPATVTYQGLTPGLVGLYQFNVVVPNVSPGDYALTVTGVGQSLFITVGN